MVFFTKGAKPMSLISYLLVILVQIGNFHVKNGFIFWKVNTDLLTVDIINKSKIIISESRKISQKEITRFFFTTSFALLLTRHKSIFNLVSLVVWKLVWTNVLYGLSKSNKKICKNRYCTLSWILTLTLAELHLCFLDLFINFFHQSQILWFVSFLF